MASVSIYQRRQPVNLKLFLGLNTLPPVIRQERLEQAIDNSYNFYGISQMLSKAAGSNIGLSEFHVVKSFFSRNPLKLVHIE